MALAVKLHHDIMILNPCNFKIKPKARPLPLPLLEICSIWHKKNAVRY